MCRTGGKKSVGEEIRCRISIHEHYLNKGMLQGARDTASWVKRSLCKHKGCELHAQNHRKRQVWKGTGDPSTGDGETDGLTDQPASLISKL